MLSKEQQQPISMDSTTSSSFISMDPNGTIETTAAKLLDYPDTDFEMSKRLQNAQNRIIILTESVASLMAENATLRSDNLISKSETMSLKIEKMANKTETVLLRAEIERLRAKYQVGGRERNTEYS